MRARRYGPGRTAPSAAGGHQPPCPGVEVLLGLPEPVGRCPVAEALGLGEAVADAKADVACAADGFADPVGMVTVPALDFEVEVPGATPAVPVDEG
jgi:hypothetical protein